MHQKPRIPPRPKEDGVSCCMMDEEGIDVEDRIVILRNYIDNGFNSL